MRGIIIILGCFLSIGLGAQIRNMDFIDDSQAAKYSWDYAAADHLVLENRFEEVTVNELAGLKAFILEYPLPTHNGENYYFRNRSYSYMMEWLFEQDEDPALLNKAIEFARTSIRYRNDNICQVDDRYTCYAIDFSRTVAPVWPNYKQDIVVRDGVDVLDPGAGVFGPVPVIAVPARMIANHPELWDQVYNDMTYREIADELMSEVQDTIDYVYQWMVGSDNLIRYSDLVNRNDWPGFVFIYNRAFPIVSGTIPLLEAYEAFDINADKIAKIDAVNQAMIDYFLGDFTFYEKDGTEVRYDPYSDVSQSKNPDKAQDFVHGSLESRDMQLLYKSGRYNLPERYIQGIANTVVDVCYLGNGTFSYRLDGSGTNSSSIIGYDGYIWYAAFREEIKEIIVDLILDRGIASQNGRMDVVALFEILKLKEELKKNESPQGIESNQALVNGGLMDLEGGWAYSWMMGYIFHANYPWLYQPEQGWIYVFDGPSADLVYMYSISHGYILMMAALPGWFYAYGPDTLLPFTA